MNMQLCSEIMYNICNKNVPHATAMSICSGNTSHSTVQRITDQGFPKKIVHRDDAKQTELA